MVLRILKRHVSSWKALLDKIGQAPIGCMKYVNRWKISFNKALKSYFKVEYLSPGNKKVWRPIGWCSFVTGKKEQANKYFQKLIDDSPSKHDLMNMGHVQWSMGNRKLALEYYKKSIAKTDFTEQEFFEVFEEDFHHLLKQGVEKDDVPIMLDQLRYFVEE